MSFSPRKAPLLLLLVLLAVPLSGCFDSIGWTRDGVGDGAWAPEMVRVPDVHDAGVTGKGVRVAIIDTGIDASHEEFVPLTESGRLLWKDLINDRPEPYDDVGHGTHVAGIVAAQGEWSTVFTGAFYLKGIAPDVTLIAIKAIGSTGQGDERVVARAVQIAVENKAQVIVLSLGGESRKLFGVVATSSQVETAVRDAVAKGVYVVAAAGNADKDGEGCTVTTPANVPEVIAVGAVDEGGKIGDFSCGGGSPNARDPHRKPEVVAPGVAMLGPWKDGGYMYATGTSQAAPVVGGILALLLEKHPDLSLKDGATVMRVKSALMATAGRIGPLAGDGAPAHDPHYGYGLVQADALLRAFEA